MISSAPPLPPGSVDLARCRFAVVDVETTGARVDRGGRIIEVAVAILEEGTVHLAYETVLDPGTRIPSWVTRLTGITERDVVGRPRFQDVATDLWRALEDGIFVAHNARFDWHHLVAEWTAAGVSTTPPGLRLCTVRLTRRLIPELRHRGLDHVSAFFGLENPARHRAFGDALTTARVLRALLGRAAERGVETLDQLIELYDRPRHKNEIPAVNSALPTPHSALQ
ncbi:MAG TPA: exonuclease domain-containing protein [Gemmatimonadales bacterium]|nr:exonuclease domain-containing protein [Gemmatimonadales bacterium]